MKYINCKTSAVSISLMLGMLEGCVHPPFYHIDVPKPALSGPIDLVTNGVQHCAIDVLGLHCWGSFEVPQEFKAAWDNSGRTTIDVAVVDPISIDLDKQLCVLGAESFCQTMEGLVGEALGISPLVQTRISLAKFTRPTVIQAAGYGAPICVISDLGIECEHHPITTTIPTFNNPTALSLGWYHACGIDASGVQCWAYGGEYAYEDSAAVAAAINVPGDLVNPSQVAVGYLSTCVLDDLGVRCWDANDYVTNIHPLNTPTQIVWGGWSGEPSRYCALDADGVACWKGGLANAQVLPTPALLNPVKIADGYQSACAIDDTGIVCW